MSPSDSELLERPIVVVGAPRSGTTVLGQLLARHPQLAHLEEPRLTWRYGNDGKSDRLLPADARPEVCTHIRRTFAAAVRNAGRRRLVEKTPSNSLRMGFVERVLPGCVFIHIIRNGTESTLAIRRFWEQHARGVKPRKMFERLREVNPRQLPYYVREVVRRTMPRALSGLVRQPVWGPRIPGIDGLLKDLSILEVSALQWRMCVEAATQMGRTLPPERYFQCRLEDMSLDVMKRIFAFCKLEDSPEVWEAFHREFDPSKASYRRANASPEDLEMIRQWTEPTMQWLGYGTFPDVGTAAQP